MTLELHAPQIFPMHLLCSAAGIALLWWGGFYG